MTVNIQTADGIGSAKRPRRTAIKVLTATVCVLMAAIIGYVGSLYFYYKRVWDDPGSFFEVDTTPLYPKDEHSEHADQINEFKPIIIVKDPEGKEQNYTFNEDIITIAFLGVDTSVHRSITQFGYQSDTMIILAYNKRTAELSMISVPRDTKAVIRRLDSNGNPIGTKITKINAAYSYGFGRTKYSYINACDALSQFCNAVPVKYYLGINMDGVETIVDAVGGVPLTIDYDYSSVDPEMVKGAKLNLTGKQALIYVRMRKLKSMDGSDYMRTYRQQNFVTAFIKKIKSLGMMDLLNNVYPTLTDVIDTNMDIAQLGALANIISKSDIDSIKKYNVEGHWDGTYWIRDEEKWQQVLLDVFYTNN